MPKIYLDNASTTFPKPAEVAEAVYKYMTGSGMNINRGCYDSAYEVEELVLETRELLCELFHGPDCRNVVFTKNVTESLNVIIKGFLKPGAHVLVSSMEHNAVMRPLVQMEKSGVSFTRIPCDEEGNLQISKKKVCGKQNLNAYTDEFEKDSVQKSMEESTSECMEQLLRKNTKAVIMMHASNVCGTVLPIKEVGEFCRKHGLKFIVDCAQTAGVFPVHMKEMNIDALAFTGHKGLLGPQGIGGFILTDEMVGEIEPLLSGGTGSISHTEEIPNFMPDRFEPGTMNLPGIIGLREGLLWLKETGIDKIRAHEQELTTRFLEGVRPLEEAGDIRIVGKKYDLNRTGVVSIQTLKKELSEAAYELDANYGIMTRVGLHCAPSAHKTLGTYPTGTIRFSFGWWNTEEHVDAALKALEEICHGI